MKAFLKTAVFGGFGALFFSAVLAAAPQPGEGHGWGPMVLPAILGEHAKRVQDALELTEAQREAAKAIRNEALEAARPKLEQMRTLHQDLQKLLEAANPDTRAVGEKTLALHQLRKELASIREQALERFRALLDANQKEKLEALEALRPHRRDAWKGGGVH
jgi:Spy/CpxP family protein refolding chaperone